MGTSKTTAAPGEQLGWLAGVDPLLKVVGLLLYLTVVLLYEQPLPLAVLASGALFLLIASPACRAPKRVGFLLSGVLGVSLLHGLLGGAPAAIINTALRLFIFIALSAALTLSTDPAHLLRSLRRLPFSPGLLIGLSVMWRTVPVLRHEFATIVAACRREGVPVGVMRPRATFRHVLVPLAFALTGFADDVALALCSRGIVLARRPLRPPLAFGRGDLLFSAVVVGLPALAVGLCA